MRKSDWIIIGFIALGWLVIAARGSHSFCDSQRCQTQYSNCVAPLNGSVLSGHEVREIINYCQAQFKDCCRGEK